MELVVFLSPMETILIGTINYKYWTEGVRWDIYVFFLRIWDDLFIDVLFPLVGGFS